MSEELSDAARRGLQRAGVHLMRAAIEVVEGISAFLDEMQGDDDDDDGSESTRGVERIELDED